MGRNERCHHQHQSPAPIPCTVRSVRTNRTEKLHNKSTGVFHGPIRGRRASNVAIALWLSIALSPLSSLNPPFSVNFRDIPGQVRRGRANLRAIAGHPRASAEYAPPCGGDRAQQPGRAVECSGECRRMLNEKVLDQVSGDTQLIMSSMVNLEGRLAGRIIAFVLDS